MSNQLTVLQNNVPAHIAQAAAAAAERNAGALVGTGGGGVDRISLKQSRFRLIEGGEEVAVLQASALNVVLLRINDGISKSYYETAWNPNNEAEAPTCYSDDGIAPSPNADKQQARTCAECPHNAWGSKINPQTQAEGKACSDSKRISVVAESYVTNPDAKVYQLSVPAASLKDLGKYVRQLNALSPVVPYNAVVTQVAFDTNATFPKLNFEPVRYLTGEEFQVAESRYESEPVKLTAGLAEAAAAHARQRAAASTIPGDNPAAGQHQAAMNSVREQGAAQAQPQQEQTQPQQQSQQAAASGFGGPEQAQPQQQAQQSQQAAASGFGAPEQEQAQPQQEQAQPQQQAAASGFGAPEQEQAQPQAQQNQQAAASGFGEVAPEQEQAQPQQQAQQAASSGFGGEVIDELDTQTGQAQEVAGEGNSLDSVFGGDWDDVK